MYKNNLFLIDKPVDVLKVDTDKMIHFFDLDGTLWKTGAMWRIVDLENNKIVFKLTQEEGQDIISGKYKESGIELPNSLYKPWISMEMWNEIIKIYPDIKLEKLGVDFSEFRDEKELRKQVEKLSVLAENANHLKKDHSSVVGVLTARGNKDAHEQILSCLLEELDERGISFDENKIYFLNDDKRSRSSGSTSFKKAKIILEHIIGYKIIDSKYTKEPQDKFNVIHFYEDEWKNFEEVYKLFSTMMKIQNNTEDKSILINSQFDCDMYLHYVGDGDWSTGYVKIYNILA